MVQVVEWCATSKIALNIENHCHIKLPLNEIPTMTDVDFKFENTKFSRCRNSGDSHICKVFGIAPNPVFSWGVSHTHGSFTKVRQLPILQWWHTEQNLLHHRATHTVAALIRLSALFEQRTHKTYGRPTVKVNCLVQIVLR